MSLISTGAMLQTAVAVADQLAARGLSIQVLSMHTVSPLDVEAVTAAAMRAKFVITLEEHCVAGGLGGAVGEVMAELPSSRAPLKRIGLPRSFNRVVGDQEYLRALHGLDVDAVVRTLEALVGQRPLAGDASIL